MIFIILFLIGGRCNKIDKRQKRTDRPITRASDWKNTSISGWRQ